MTTYDFDLGVIGGGAAGLTVTAGAAQLGARTLLIEKEDFLGGDCLHYGCVPSKTLIKSARVYHLMKNGSKFGLPPVAVEPVDFRRVAARISSVIATIQNHDSVERFCKLGAKVEFGQPFFVDEHSVKLSSKIYSARNWVITTGSSPASPPITGIEESGYLTNREIFSLDRLPASMIILGGGPIAMEMAQAFSRLGSRIDVIQRSEQILTKEDRDLADKLMAAMSEEGVHFHLRTTVERVRSRGNHKEVLFTDANGNRAELAADAILVAMGRAANVNDLGLDNIGVVHDAKGIAVDNRLRTNHKHIYAAGDVTGSFQFTHAAGYEGGVVISNAIFHLPRKVDYTLLPWCTYTNPELASIGMNEKRATAAAIRYSVWEENFADNDRSLAEGEEKGTIKMLLDDNEKPLGIQILGPRAGDLMGEWVAVLNGRIKLSTLAAATHPYPTMAEINKKVASSLLARKIFSEKVIKGLKFFFNLKGRACQ